MRNKLMIGVSLISILGWTPAVVAQSSAPSATSQSGDLEEIVVTAQRRAQNIQDVPIAITSFSAKDMQLQQINDTTDLPKFIPNFFSSNNTGTGSGNTYFLRGLGQNESFPTFDPQVGTYVDDIYIGRESASNFALFDVDQIQVLRGPQGTLFGRNATGGAIVISNARPSDNFGGYVEASYGSYNGFTGRASINLPISEELLTKTSAYGVRDDGYVDDLVTGQKLNGHNDYGVREAILFRPAGLDNVVWNASADYSDNNFDSNQNFPLNGKRVSYSGFGDLSIPITVIGGQSVINDVNTVLKEPITNLVNQEDLLVWGAMSNIEVIFDSGTLNFISGLRAQRQLSAGDFPDPIDSGPVVPYDENYLGQYGLAINSIDRQWSQEVKWTGKTLGDKLTYTAGLFYLYEENNSDFLQTFTYPTGPSPAVTAIELNTAQHFRNTTNSEAVYAQADYAADDQLTFTLGARYTHEVKDFTASANLADGGFDTAAVLAAGNRTHLSTDQLTPRASVQYKITPDVMVFASATRGFQGGGWNSLTGEAIQVTAFGPETLWTYETGFRSELFDKTLRFNADFFYNDIRNYQLVTLGPGGGANFVTENAADLIDYGIEADVSYIPFKNLTLTASLGLENGYYINPSVGTVQQQIACKTGTTADCLQGIVNANGNLAQPESLPPFTFALSAVYVWNFDAFKLTPVAALQYMQANHVDTQGAPQGLSASHYTLDLGVTFQLKDHPWTITAECKNCTMSNFETVDLFVPYFNDPGTWDVKVRFPF